MIPELSAKIAWSFIEAPVIRYLFKRKLSKVLHDTLSGHGQEKVKLNLHNKTSVLNYCTSCFNPRIPEKSLDFLAGALAFEFAREKIKYSNEELCELCFSISENWFLALLNDNILRRHLMDRFGFRPADALREISPPRSSTLQSLLNPLNAQKSYFENFSDGGGTYKIEVYIPDSTSGTVSESGPSVNISFKSLSRIQLGFFQVGYDYRLGKPYESWLKIVFTDNELTREFPDFGYRPDFGWPETTVPIWAR